MKKLLCLMLALAALPMMAMAPAEVDMEMQTPVVVEEEAVVESDTPTPYWINIRSIVCNAKKSGSSINMTATMVCKDVDDLSIEATVYKDVNGSWVYQGGASASKTTDYIGLNGNCPVQSGYEYMVTFDFYSGGESTSVDRYVSM